MTKTIKLDNERNYLVDRITGELIRKYDHNNEDIQLVLQLDDSRLVVDKSQIAMEYGDQIVVRYKDDLYIIDDGCQPIMIKAGYIVYKNYDQENILNREEGMTTLNEIMAHAHNKILDNMSTFNPYSDQFVDFEYDAKYHEYSFQTGAFKYFVKLNTVTSIVSKNQLRKDNSLPFYPFDKRMDKFGTIYVSVFAEKIDYNADNSAKYDVANDFIKNLLVAMGPDYHFIPQIIKRRIIMAKGL